MCIFFSGNVIKKIHWNTQKKKKGGEKAAAGRGVSLDGPLDRFWSVRLLSPVTTTTTSTTTTRTEENGVARGLWEGQGEQWDFRPATCDQDHLQHSDESAEARIDRDYTKVYPSFRINEQTHPFWGGKTISLPVKGGQVPSLGLLTTQDKRHVTQPTRKDNTWTVSPGTGL